MKPIKLKIAGLHSFRQEQEVDFEALCANGLFGIFGPTGSGKSTVLDAITLALYGKVERASHGTQGIVNQAEDRLLVEFTFELKHASGNKRYRVERLYKRTRDNAVNCSRARLLELSGGAEVPLADKAGQVTDQVQAMLGLNVDDFTRAVVLPQGKFDEFLKKIKPVERRGMLERLFGLAEYGEKLRKKVDNRLKEVDKRLEGVEGVLKGLGDASDEALEQAQQRAEAAKRVAEEASEALKTAEEDHKAKEQIWQWQEELAGVARRMSRLNEREPEINLAEQRLDAAQRADIVAPLLHEVDDAEKDVAEAEARLASIKTERDQAAASASDAEGLLRTAREARVQQEPELHRKQERLRQALEIENELAGIRQTESDIADDFRARTREMTAADASLAAQRAVRDEIEESLRACRRQLVDTNVDPERRKRVEAALAALREWHRAEQDHRKEMADQEAKFKTREAAREALAKAEAVERDAAARLAEAAGTEKALRRSRPEADSVALQRLAKAQAGLRVQVARVLDLHGSVERTTAALRDAEDEVSQASSTAKAAENAVAGAMVAVNEAKQRVLELEQRLDVARARDIAGQLARSLMAGEPCPVCGSREHPQPGFVAVPEEIDTLEQELTRARNTEEAARDALRKAERDATAANTRCEAADRSLQEVQGRLSECQENLASAINQLPVNWAGLIPAEMEARLAVEERSLDVSQSAWNEWQEQMEQVQVDLNTVRDKHSEASRVLATAQESFKAAETAAQDACGRAEASYAALLYSRDRLDEARKDLEVDAIEGEKERIEALDQQRSELEKRRASLEEELSAAGAEIEALAAKVNTLAVAVSTGEQRLKEIREQLAAKEASLKGLTGGRPAADLLNEVEARLQELIAGERQAEEEARRAGERLNLLEKNLAAAESTLHGARDRLEAGLTKLDAALAKTRFATRNEAAQAILDAEEQDVLLKEIKAFREAQHGLTTLEQSLTGRLAGRSLSLDEWHACQEALADIRQAKDKALQDSGAALEEYGRLSVDNARWKEVKQVAEGINKDKNRLETLKRLLHGNAFVDYLAEEQLVNVARDASARLGQLTRHRYALEVDSEGGFVIRDEANGGVKRPVSTLSGGETFVASLALALSLSAQIQLKGSYPLEFFFLDEGFGSLDPDLLEVVVSTLEQLRMEHVNIGVISHVPELRQRLPRRLVVQPANAAGNGSRLTLEMA